LSDRTISLDVTHIEQIRAWFGRPLREMRPADADAYFEKALQGGTGRLTCAGFLVLTPDA